MLIELSSLVLYATAEWGMFAGWKGIISTSNGVRLWRDDVYLNYFEARDRARTRLGQFYAEKMLCNSCHLVLTRHTAMIDLAHIDAGIEGQVFYCSFTCWSDVMSEAFDG